MSGETVDYWNGTNPVLQFAADRSLETMAGPKSKLWMPKVMGKTIWPYDEVKGHRDYLMLRM